MNAKRDLTAKEIAANAGLRIRAIKKSYDNPYQKLSVTTVGSKVAWLFNPYSMWPSDRPT